MDRNQVIGLVLISAILIAYLQFFAPEPIEEEVVENAQVTQVDSKKQVEEPDLVGNSEINELTDSVLNIQNKSKYGDFA